jgi:hypothetical protein
MKRIKKPKTRVCPDCGYKSDLFCQGICIKCYNRKKYEKDEYIPFKDLSKDKKERIMRLREKDLQKSTNNIETNNIETNAIDTIEQEPEQEPEVTIVNDETLKNTIEKISNNVIRSVATSDLQKDIVLKDIQNSFDKNNTTYPKESNPILNIYSIMESLIVNHNKDYIDSCMQAESILTSLEHDYRHAKEYYSSELEECLNAKTYDAEKFNAIKEKKRIWEERHNILLEERRKIKYRISEYNIAESIFSDLSKDTSFMFKFKKAGERLHILNIYYDDKKYSAEISDLVREESFCTGFKSNKSIKENMIEQIVNPERLYKVTIQTVSKGKIGKFTRSVYAFDEKSAIDKVFKFIDTQPDKFKFDVCKNTAKAEKQPIS